MPSIRSLLAGIALTSFALIQHTTALPIAPCDDDAPALPVNGGATELPSTNLTLAYVTIGRGVQNYTCSAVGAAPVLQGAVAKLYDATPLAHRSPNNLHTLPAKYSSKPLPSASQPFQGLPYLGHHFFDAGGVPVFTLTAARGPSKPIIYVQRIAAIPAPTTAAGPAGVDWLDLGEKSVAPYIGLTVGLKQVYRVVTAGGLGGTCDKVGLKSVQYATEYWFYK